MRYTGRHPDDRFQDEAEYRLVRARILVASPDSHGYPEYEYAANPDDPDVPRAHHLAEYCGDDRDGRYQREPWPVVNPRPHGNIDGDNENQQGKPVVTNELSQIRRLLVDG